MRGYDPVKLIDSVRGTVGLHYSKSKPRINANTEVVISYQ
jgi:hypothetical protein